MSDLGLIVEASGDCAPDSRSAPLLRSRPGVFGRWYVAVGSFAFGTALCALLGNYAMFYFFGPWDDEGYALIALKAFAHHGGLYTHVYSQFGPFYFEAFAAVFTWLPITPDSGRVATLVVALLTSLGMGVGIRMFTDSVLAGVATQMGSFVLLMITFPALSMHPSIVACLLFAVALIALALVARGQRGLGCTILGATLAALVLTQVNVGAFAAIAVLFTGLTLAPPLRAMRLPRAAAAVLFVGTPFLLIGVAGGHATKSWALTFALIVTLAAAGVVVLTVDRGLQGLVHGRDAYRFLLGGGILGAVVVVIALLSGTRPVDLIRGVFIGPASQSNVFPIPLRLPVGVGVWGVVCLAGAILYRRYRLRNPQAGLVDSCAHVVVGVLILYCALGQAQVHKPASFAFSFTVALPLLFFAAIPPVGATESERIARVAVVAFAVLEGLLVYPVGGAELYWASLLLVPTGILCVHDGFRQLRPALAAARHRKPRVATGLAASVLLVAGVAWLAWVFVGNLSADASSYDARVSVSLPGSAMVRLPAPQAATLESLSQAIRTQCSSFVTLPGMNSFYFWTEERPPTWFNTTSWMYLFDYARQEQIVDSIERQRQPQFCVVDNPYWLSFWEQGHPLPQLPLLRLVERFEQNNGPPKLFEGYRLFVSRGAAR